MLEKTDQRILVLGIPIFRDYLISFHMDGQLDIYHSNSALLSEQ